MKNKVLHFTVILGIILMCSCVEDFDFYRVKIINNSNQEVFVYYTQGYGPVTANNINIVNPIGPCTAISKGESFEYVLRIAKEYRDGAYVAFLFSDKEIDITTDDINQESTDGETRKLLFLKYSLWELIQMDCTITFNGFENE